MSANPKNGHKTLIDSKEVTNITIKPLYTPHSLTIVISIMAIYILTVFFFGPADSADFKSTISYGVKAAMVIFVLLGTMILPNGPFIRPHPIFWNLFLSVSLIYLVFIIFLSYQSPENARKIINFFDENAGFQQNVKQYAVNCAFTFENVWGNINDIFFVGHFLGWAAKSLIVRNRLICWSLSVFWEMLEYSLIFFFPNFAECWWDSLLLDIMICNALGIEFGLALCNLFEMKEYHWSGVLELHSFGAKLRRVALQFSPESWMRVRWEPMSTIKRFFAANVLAFFLLLVDINSFTLKAALLIPAESSINVIRLLMWFGIGMPAIRQYYVYVTDPECERMGSMTITSVLTLVAELALSIKLTAGDVQAVPRFSLLLWTAYAAGYLALCAVLVLRVKKTRNKRDL